MSGAADNLDDVGRHADAAVLRTGRAPAQGGPGVRGTSFQALHANTASQSAQDRDFNTYLPVERVADIFYHDDTPKLVLNADGTLLEANLAGRRLVELRILNHTADFRLVFGSSAVNARARRCIASAMETGGPCRMFKRYDGTDWLILDFERIDTASAPLVVASVRSRSGSTSDSVEAIQEAMSLTDQEARVAEGLCRALSAKEIARELGISPNTVRAHLRAIYAKCGQRGYHNTLRLLMSLLG